MTLPKDAKARKGIPIYSGCIKYFPDALAAVAQVSYIGNAQHHPDKPLHWDKSKSTDELDALTRHLLESGDRDEDGVLHAAKVAWRALANLQRIADSGEDVLASNTAISRDLTEQSAGEHSWPDTWASMELGETVLEHQVCWKCGAQRTRTAEMRDGIRYVSETNDELGPCKDG